MEIWRNLRSGGYGKLLDGRLAYRNGRCFSYDKLWIEHKGPYIAGSPRQ